MAVIKIILELSKDSQSDSLRRKLPYLWTIFGPQFDQCVDEQQKTKKFPTLNEAKNVSN